ncbi:MAG: TPR repeat protein [Bradymonadia bacterium]|jgi:TPR repeat protein
MVIILSSFGGRALLVLVLMFAAAGSVAAPAEQARAKPTDPRAALLALAKPPVGLKSSLQMCVAGAEAVACRLACDGGEADACYVLWKMSLRGSGGATKLAEGSAELLAIWLTQQRAAERKCRAGDAGSCLRAMVLYESSPLASPALARELKALGQPLFLRACEGGDTDACAGVTIDARDRALRRTWATTVETIAVEACGRGDYKGCQRLVRNSSDDPDAVKGVGLRMVELAEKQCVEERDGGACHVAAEQHRSGGHVKQDIGRSLGLYGIACQQGEAYDCQRLGELYEKGEPLADAEIVAAFAARACDLGSAWGCGKQPAKPVAITPKVAEAPLRITRATAPATNTIAEEVRAIRAASGADLAALGARLRNFAGRGRPARAALLELAVDTELSKNHRQAAGALSAAVLLFCRDESVELATKSANPMQVVAAARNLALIGGAANNQVQAQIAARFKGRDDRLVAAVESFADAAPANARLTDHQLELLDKVYSLRDRDQVFISAAALAVDHQENLAWALKRMLTLPMERAHQLTIIAIIRSRTK